MELVVESIRQFIQGFFTDQRFGDKVTLGIEVVDGLEVVSFPPFAVGILGFAAENVLHDNMVCWRASKESAESHIWRENIVCDPHQDGVWMVSHVIIVWLEEVCLEKRMLETAREALNDEVAVKGGEERLPL